MDHRTIGTKSAGGTNLRVLYDQDGLRIVTRRTLPASWEARYVASTIAWQQWLRNCEAKEHGETNATSTQRETTCSEHCQGGDFRRVSSWIGQTARD